MQALFELAVGVGQLLVQIVGPVLRCFQSQRREDPSLELHQAERFIQEIVGPLVQEQGHFVGGCLARQDDHLQIDQPVVGADSLQHFTSRYARHEQVEKDQIVWLARQGRQRLFAALNEIALNFKYFENVRARSLAVLLVVDDEHPRRRRRRRGQRLRPHAPG